MWDRTVLVTYPEPSEDETPFLQLSVAYFGYSTTQMFYGQQQDFALARQQGSERDHD
jgi:hypothetical protein